MSRPSVHRATNGSVRERSRAALLIVDMISDYRFPDAPALLRGLRPVAGRIAALKERLHRARIPTLYINDNVGRWRSDAARLVRDCSRVGEPGADIVKLLAPADHDYFIFKPRHSGFYGTALETVLSYLGARTLVITGVSSHQCVLFTANHAYVRDFEIHLPSDCIAAPTAKDTRFALRYFEQVLGASTKPSRGLSLPALRHQGVSARRG